MMHSSMAWRLLRYVFAAYYLLVGGYVLLSLAGFVPAPQPKVSDASAAFQAALWQTGFMLPLLGLVYVAGACALFVERSTPLGIVLLAPAVVVIFFTNTLLDTAWIAGTVNAAVLAALAWRYRMAFMPLWNYGRSAA